MQRIIIGTAGHVDHGKTALVQRLTGVDTDRLPAEKSRGITIELGFAPWRLSEKITADIIDVPGHEKFVRTMSGGVAAVDMALLLVAADEGFMAQTREHLAILSLLGITAGVIVISKCDLAARAEIDSLKKTIRRELAGSTLENAPITAVSALTGEGMENLQKTVRQTVESIIARRTPEKSDLNKLSRLPVDRCFSVKGFGTVATGTLWSGGFAVGDTVNIMSADGKQAKTAAAKIRRLEINGENAPQCLGKQRLALNLPALSKEQIPRGSWICNEILTPVHTAAVDFYLLKNAKQLKNNAPVHIRFGGLEVNARIRFDGEIMRPDSRQSVKIHFEKPIFPLAGDLLLAASYSPVTTIGGGKITAVNPPKKRQTNGEKREQQNLLLWQRAETVLGNYHQNQPMALGMAESEVKKKLLNNLPPTRQRELLANWQTAGKIKNQNGKISLADFTPKLDGKTAKIAEKALTALAKSRLKPDDWAVLIKELPPTKQKQLTELLTAQGKIQSADGIIFAAAALSDAEKAVTVYLRQNKKITLAETRDLLQTSRKFALAILSYLDGKGVTVRKGDYRILSKSEN